MKLPPRALLWRLLRLGWLLLGILPATAFADSAPSIPNTPAGQALTSWLKAFNSGNHADMEVFLRAYEPELSIDSAIKWRDEVGGYDLLTVYSSTPRGIAFLVRARKSPTEEVGRVTVTPAKDPVVRMQGTYYIPHGVAFLGFDLDKATRQAVIRSTIENLTEHYVFPQVGNAMALRLAQNEKRGRYAETDGEGLAKALTSDMREISHDKHLLVAFKPFREPAVSPEKGRADVGPAAKDCAFTNIQRLPNNIGYIKLDGFVSSDACGEVRSAAMAFLAGVDALIFDLRDNRGGGGSDKGPDLASYLFDKPTHLSDFYDRNTGKTTETWVQPITAEKSLATIPVYVLTSKITFSAAEYFAYSLQALKRVTVVGEVTAGGSHLVTTERIDDRFIIRVPFGRPINPITKTDWEDVGVIPDVQVPASEALATAEKLATEVLQKRPK